MKWISVEGRLPEDTETDYIVFIPILKEHDLVLAFFEKELDVETNKLDSVWGSFRCTCCYVIWANEKDIQVTHWMPLPDKPEID